MAWTWVTKARASSSVMLGPCGLASKSSTSKSPGPGCTVSIKNSACSTPSAPVPKWEAPDRQRSEEHTSELQSRGLNSYAVFCLKKNFLFFSIFCFFWPQWLFLFNSHLSSLGSFDFVLFGFFSLL